jgi:hypothetical protein
MKIFLFLLFSTLLSISLTTKAESGFFTEGTEVGSNLNFYFTGLLSRSERNANQEISGNDYNNVSLSYRLKNWSGLLENSNISESSGNFSSNMTRLHQEWVGWARYHFYNDNSDVYQSSLFAGVGLGVFQEEIKTNLLGTTRTDKTDNLFISGLSVGWDGSYFITMNWALAAVLEVRVFGSKEIDPNPAIDEAFRLGIQYHF